MTASDRVYITACCTPQKTSAEYRKLFVAATKFLTHYKINACHIFSALDILNFYKEDVIAH